MNRRTFLRQAALAGCLPLLRPGYALAAAAPPAGLTLKIITCNIRVDVPEDKRADDGWAQRREFCAEVIRNQRADVICLQECQHAHITFLRAQLPQYDAYGLANPGLLYHPINSILFRRERFELISAGGFWLSTTPHVAGSKSWDSHSARFANWVQLRERATGREFRSWNTHLDHIGQTAREKGAELINQACQAYPKEYPQFLTADFNAGARNPAIMALKAGGWTDTYEAVHGSQDPGFTFHAFKGAQYPGGTANGGLKPKIDFVFCRGTVKPTAAAILRDSREGRYPSDHYFVAAEATL